MLENPALKASSLLSTHYLYYDIRVKGWVVVRKADRLIVSKPRNSIDAENLRESFNKALVQGSIPLYEKVAYSSL